MKPIPAPTEPNLKKIILIGLIGNVMEWYDFAVYGYFAAVIGRLFFPGNDPNVSLIASFGAFAAGFLVRPLGGLVFGRIGDRIGRQKAMSLSVLAMAIPTVLMASMPTYQEIGIWAPIGLILLRIIQGLSVGGEFTSSLVYLTENAPQNRRAFTAVWGSWGATAGILIGSTVGLVVSNLLPEPKIIAWGWRLPFVMGGLIALIGWWIRRDTEADLPVQAAKAPVQHLFRQHKRDVLRVILLNIGSGVAFYTAFIYAVTYIRNIDDMPEGVALEVNSVAMLVLLIILPLSAWLSDHLGRRPLLILGSGSVMLLSVPIFMLLHSSNSLHILIGEVLFAVLVGITNGAIVAYNVELMPSAVRCTGLALAYNIAIGVFGGTTPMIAALLISQSGNPLAPAFWMSGAAFISLCVILFWAEETHRKPLHHSAGHGEK